MNKTILILFCTFHIHVLKAKIIEIPNDATTIQEGINLAETGDTILISKGTYFENLKINKKITVASKFLLSNDFSDVEETIINGQTNAVFEVTAPKNDTSLVIGLTIKNGDDGLMVESPVHILDNIIEECEDGIDYETGGSGKCINNIFRNNLDDGIDLDGTLPFIVIDNNIIANNDDDGIEIRLHNQKGFFCYCRIVNNKIYGNGEDGIQFIDYADTTDRVYYVERNLIYDNDMAGIACMDNGETTEDYRGAPIPEPIYLLNNTISGHIYGISGGAGLCAVNNIVINSENTGMFNVTGESIASYNLFYNNQKDTTNSNLDEQTNLFEDPLLNEDFTLKNNSPCVDKGIHFYIYENDTALDMDDNMFNGEAPDIGAVEYTVSSSSIFNGNTNDEIRVFPNPFLDWFGIQKKDGLISGSVKMINSDGKTIKNILLKESYTTVETDNYPAGIYFLKYFNGSGIKSFKIIKL